MKILIVRIALSLCVVLGAQCAASAAFVVSEDFESSTPSPYTWSQQNSNPALATDSDPATTTGVAYSAQPGDWFAYKKSSVPDIDIQVFNGATPGAAGGSNYMRIHRGGDADVAIGFAFRPYNSPVTGGIVTANWKMFLPQQSPAIGAQAGIWLTSALDNDSSIGLSDSTPVLFTFNPIGNTENIRYSENNFANNPRFTSPVVTTGVWQQWQLITDLNSGLSTVSVNGVVSPAFPHNHAINQASALVFQGAQGGAEYYVDDISVSYVPEPTSLGLMAFGAVIAMFRRR